MDTLSFLSVEGKGRKGRTWLGKHTIKKQMMTLEYAGFGTRIVQDTRDGSVYVDDGTYLSPYSFSDDVEKEAE